MSFFAEQDRARRATTRLVTFYVAAVAAIVVAVNLVVVPVQMVFTAKPGWVEALLYNRPWHLYALASGSDYAWISAITLLVIATGTAEIMAHLALGEAAIASMLGGSKLGYGRSGSSESRLANVVEEMAIASGLAVPCVYVLPRENSINTFAAGRSLNQAFIVVTQGALERLSRDEMQGVIAHEFSHILNGDLRLNLRALCALQGILVVSEAGRFMMRYYSGYGTEEGRRFFLLPLAIIGAGVFLAGSVGLVAARLIQAALAREREYLADACAVQYTRNPDGLCGALARIHTEAAGSRLMNWHAGALGHMLFVPGVKQWLGRRLATHPEISERIRRANPQASLELYLERLKPRRGGAPGRAEEQPAKPDVLAMVSLPVSIAPKQLTGVTAMIASIGQPGIEHLEYARGLLAYLPASLRDALATADGAQAVMIGALIEEDHSARGLQLEALGTLGLESLARRGEVLSPLIRSLDRAYRLPMVALAIPSLRGLDTPSRDLFLAALRAVIEADRRVSLDEFVMLTIFDWNLGPRARLSGSVRYRSRMEISTDAGLVLSLLAQAGAEVQNDSVSAFTCGANVFGDPKLTLLPKADIHLGAVTTGLERLALLAPLEKAAFLDACHAVAGADGILRLVEFELVRAIAVALNCPMPPALAAADPRLLRQ